MLHINLTDNRLHMNCSGYYILGTNQEFLGKYEFKNPINVYTEPAILSNEE